MTVEEKWNKKWEALKLHKYKGNRERKFYLLEMFAYPSGDLHMGHMRNYVLGDVLMRYKIMNGYDVIHPVGWDAFGLPAEEAAIKRNIAPDQWTMNNIKVSSNTLKKMGLLYDWDREVITCKSDYYKWTQWIFLKLYEKGLAYRKKAFVNWCSKCNTVLANEQVEQGRCWRCKTDIIKKQKEQWFVKITDYAEELLKDLELLKDWPDNVKTMQKNWIGKSEGLLISFKVENSDIDIKVFTTRPDTLFGVTYVAIAPENELINKLNIPADRMEGIKEYINKAIMKTEIERIAENRKKDGIWTGLYAINPLNNEKVQIWIADYVLNSYGTGAVMAVPAHDQRDFEFALQYSLDIKPVIIPKDNDWDFTKSAFIDKGIMINSQQFNDMSSEECIKAIMDYVEHNNWGKRITNFRIRDWLISRQRYWGAPIPMIHCEHCGIVPVPESDLPVLLPNSDEVDFLPKGESPLASCESFINVKCPKCNADAKRDPDTMDTFVDSSWYQLRYVDAKNDKEIFNREKADEQLPVDMYIGGVEHANGHLIYFRFITKFLRDIGLHKYNEPALKLFNQGMIMDSKGEIMSKSKGNAVNVGPFIEKYGSDLARSTMLFIGPGYKDALWSEDGIIGMKRFIERLERISEKYIDKNAINIKPNNDKEQIIFIKMHKTIKKVGEDIEKFEHNTAIASIMELLNMIYKYEKDIAPDFISSIIFNILKLVSVFIPHISEELFSKYEIAESVFLTKWPEYDKQYLTEDNVTIVVQINGKIRAQLNMPFNSDEDTVYNEAVNDKNVKKYLDNKTLLKRIYIKNKLLSLVVK